MKLSPFVLATLLSVNAFTYYEHIAPREIAKNKSHEIIFPNKEDSPAISDDKVIIEKTKGLYLVGGREDVVYDGVDINGVAFHNLDVPGKSHLLKEKLKPLFYDEPLTLKKIGKIKDAIYEYYHKNKRPVVKVLIPEQNVSTGTLQLIVLEAKIGNVEMKGSEWFDDEKLRDYVRLQLDDSIDSNTLAADLQWINQNPFRQTNVVLKPGELEGTTDVEFWTQDRRPWRIYAGAENTGFESTGEGRLFAGLNWGDVFGLDQILSYQYTTSTDFGRFYAHTGHYTIPLSWRDVFTVFGGYSRVNAKMTLGDMSNTGRSSQVSARYTIPLQPRGTFLHEISFGADYKKTNTNLVFADVPIVAKTAVITQAAFAYNGTHHTSFADTSLNLELFAMPGDYFGHQSNADFDSLRPFAKNNYIYGHLTLIPVFKLPRDFTLSFNTQLQLAGANLLSSEQFGLGGYSTVRGYDEREVNSDNGFLFSTEARTPAIHLINMGNSKKIRDNLQFLAFIDYGIGWDHHLVEGQKKSQYLIGVGPGLRYTLAEYLTLRADLGFKLHRTGLLNDNSLTKFHFSVLASY